MRGRPVGAMVTGMAEPHCSNCCPRKPTKPDPPQRLTAGVFLWLTGAVLIVLGTWALLIWALTTLS